jgi:hypothetical protein
MERLTAMCIGIYITVKETWQNNKQFLISDCFFGRGGGGGGGVNKKWVKKTRKKI